MILLLIWAAIFAAMFVLLTRGGCDYHCQENDHVPTRYHKRFW